MNRIIHTLLIPLFCLLASCGAYFVDTGTLKDGHVEGTELLGKWGNDGALIVFTDGADNADRFCFAEDDSLIKANAYVVPITSGHMVILSDFIDPDAPEKPPFKGEYLMLLAETPNGSRDLVRPFDHIEEGDLLPFAVHCPQAHPEGTLAEAGFIPFCLNPDTSAEEITAWAGSQSQITVEATLSPKPAANIPSFCQD